MRRITNEEMRIGWAYWLSSLFFFIMLLGGLWLIFADGGKDRGVGIAVTIVGAAFFAGSIAWPMLRRREAQGVTTDLIRTAEIHCEAVFFPASKVKYHVTLWGSLALTVGSIGLSLAADSVENRIKGVVASAFFGGVVVSCLWSARQGRFGVALLADGVIWREMFRSPYFIPWNAVARSGLFEKKEKNVPRLIPSFGILVTNPLLVRTSRRSRRKMISAERQSGWHLYFFAETIAAPLFLLAQMVELYHLHPELRNELADGTGLARVQRLSLSAIEVPA